jgi:hypothetical protein
MCDTIWAVYMSSNQRHHHQEYGAVEDQRVREAHCTGTSRSACIHLCTALGFWPTCTCILKGMHGHLFIMYPVLPPPTRYSQGLWQLPGGGLAPLPAAGAAIAAGSPPIMLKVKDWPPKKDFAVSLPRHFMVRAMPTHAQEADRQPNNWLFPGPTAPLHCVVNADNSCSEQLPLVTVNHARTHPLICTAPLATKLTAAGQS